MSARLEQSPDDLQLLIGGIIQKIEVVEEFGEPSIQLSIALPKPRQLEGVLADAVQYQVWQDEEGNGPGFLALVAVSEVQSTPVTGHQLANAVAAEGKRPCTFCGEHVTSTNPDTDYCRSCYYAGRGLERQHADLIFQIGDLEEVMDVDVRHTGGGCFNLAITLADGRYLTPSCAVVEGGKVEAEPGLPEKGTDERWALVVSRDERAWEDWSEARLEILQETFDDDELVAAIKRVSETPISEGEPGA